MKCNHCGSSDIDEDPSRGDSVCTNCGSVLESSTLVSEVQFEDNAFGGCSVVGKFVPSDSSGGAKGFKRNFHSGLGQTSREITLKNAKKAVSDLCQQLHLNEKFIDISFNFYKLALNRNLTKGCKNALIVAACVYMTCRLEGSMQLLIDFSDILQINVYELGRTFLRLSRELHISIPSIDPCLYILRFASRLQFGFRTHEVSMTALRLLQRMKTDSIHSGRRPSGLCGAAILIAARLHDFSRSIEDVVKVVKVHHSTLRKRLIEFGETPTSCLTLEEFLTVDLQEEQDAPSFKAARIKDQERLTTDSTLNQLSDIQKEIDSLLDSSKPRKGMTAFIQSLPICEISIEQDQFDKTNERVSNVDFAADIITESCSNLHDYLDMDRLSNVGPDILSFNLGSSISSSLETRDVTLQFSSQDSNGELITSDIDDNELESYILSEEEINKKSALWKTVNEDYLEKQKVRAQERSQMLKDGGKSKKKRKIAGIRNTVNIYARTAHEAFSKMLKEKHLSNKINYDVLKDLSKDFGSELIARRF